MVVETYCMEYPLAYFHDTVRCCNTTVATRGAMVRREWRCEILLEPWWCVFWILTSQAQGEIIDNKGVAIL